MHYEENFYLNAAGKRHFYRLWKAEKSRAVLVCLHGIGTGSWRFLEMGEYLAEKGITVYAPDLRSYGCNEGTKAYVKTFYEYVQDWEVFRRDVLLKQGIKEYYLSGDSLGGLISLYIALHKPLGLKKLILTSPALRQRVKVSSFTLFMAKIALFLAPKLHFAVPIYPQDIVNDPEYAQKMHLSTFEIRYITPVMYNALNKATREVWRKAKTLEVSTIIYQAGKDTIVAPEAPAEFAQLAPHCEIRILPEAKHSFINDFGKEKIYDLFLREML